MYLHLHLFESIPICKYFQKNMAICSLIKVKKNWSAWFIFQIVSECCFVYAYYIRISISHSLFWIRNTDYCHLLLWTVVISRAGAECTCKMTISCSFCSVFKSNFYARHLFLRQNIQEARDLSKVSINLVAVLHNWDINEIWSDGQLVRCGRVALIRS